VCVACLSPHFTQRMQTLDFSFTDFFRVDHSAARSKAWTVFARLNAGIVGSNPTEGMDVCVYSEFVCRQRPCDGPITRPRSPTDGLKLRNWSETKRFTDALWSKLGATGKRQRETVPPAVSMVKKSICGWKHIDIALLHPTKLHLWVRWRVGVEFIFTICSCRNCRKWL
jgi:hypothetical protein